MDLRSLFGLRRSARTRQALRVECASWADGPQAPPGADERRPGLAGSVLHDGGCSLAELAAGEDARVEAMDAGSSARLGRLSAFGVAPGARLKVIRTRPALLVEVGGTLLAIESEVASAIHVRRPGPDP